MERLAPVPGGRRVPPSRVARGERAERTLGYLADHGAASSTSTARRTAGHPTIMPPVDAVTRDDVAYMRAPRAQPEGYTRGKTVAERFGWRYSDDELEELAERVRGLAEQAGEVRVLFNTNRGDDAPTAARQFAALWARTPGRRPRKRSCASRRAEHPRRR